jgi:flagellar hook-length control protein FliK
MPDITLNLPASNAPLASGSPVGEVRGIGSDASAEDAATAFAALLQDSLKLSPEEDSAGLLARLMAEEAEESDLSDPLLADPALAAPELLAGSLLLSPALKLVEEPVGRKVSADGDDEFGLADPVRGLRTGREGDDVAQDELPAAAIAAQNGTTGESDGKNLPDLQLAADLKPDTGLPVAQHTDFRGHLSAAQRAAPELAVATPISHPGWADDVGHQITWLAEQGTSRAELILTPPHLGRIEISLQIGTDLSSAQFVSASPQVREALEQALPRLREMLAGSGISLGEANVSGEQRSGEQGQGGQRGGRGREAAGEIDPLIAPPVARRGAGLVDLFA